MRQADARALIAAVALCLSATIQPLDAATEGLLSPSDRKIYRDAFAAAARNQWRLASRRARAGSDPLPRKILLWHAVMRPGAKVPFPRIAAFITANPDWPGMNVLLRRAEESMHFWTPPQLIVDWFHNRTPRTTDGGFMLAVALMSVGRHDDAIERARKTWRNFSFGRTQQRNFLKRFGKVLTASDHSERFDRLLWRGNFAQVRRMWKMVSAEERALATARMRLRRLRGGADNAIERVPEALQAHPALIYERLRWRRRKGRTDEAAEILLNPPDNLVRPDYWMKERAYISRALLSTGRYREAYRIASHHGIRAGPNFAEAEWLAGWIALRFLGARRIALDHFEHAFTAVTKPISRARVAYWAGRAADSLGATERASQWFGKAAIYDATFYGQLAAEREFGGVLPTLLGEPRPDGAKIAEFNRNELVRAVFMLKELRQRNLLRPFVVQLAKLSNDPARQVLAGRLALAIDRPDIGVQVARHAYRTGNPFVTLGYPVIDTPTGGLERALLLSVVLQESDFKTRARSHAGARGIMQIMPATARLVARKLKIRYSRRRLATDPNYNIRIGRAYLKSLLRRFGGSYMLAIAGYNAGPNTVSRWIQQYGDPRSDEVDAVDWVEMIPYEETRNYVQRVLESLQVYRRRLHDGRLVYSLENDLENILSR